MLAKKVTKDNDFLTATQSKHPLLASRLKCTLKKHDSGISSPYTIATKDTVRLQDSEIKHLKKKNVSAVGKPFLYLTAMSAELLFLFSQTF